MESLGFKTEEVEAYLALHDHGSCSAADLARRIDAKRPTAYVYLERLMDGGLVTQSQRHGIKLFTAEPAEKILVLYRRKIEFLQRKEANMTKILPEMKRREKTGGMRPRMQFFEGRYGMEDALENILTAPSGTLTLSFWPIQAAVGATSRDFFHYHNKERIRRNIYVHGLWPRGQSVNIKLNPFLGWGKRFKRELRYVPEGFDFTMGYWIYGNKIVFLSSRYESYGFIVESPELCQMMSVQHKIVWDVSTPIPFNEKDVEDFLKEVEQGD